MICTYEDYCLRFASEAEGMGVLFTQHPEVVADDGTVTAEAYATPNFQNVDVVGTIFDTTDPENPVPYDGWHANVRLVVGAEDATPLLPFVVHPRHPRRVWA